MSQPSSATLSRTSRHPRQVDPRALRFGAALTSVVLAAALVTPPIVAAALLVAQAAVFAVSALVDLRLSPYAQLFARGLRPRLGEPAALEDARPPRFAQLVGLAFVLVALLGLALGLPALYTAATAMALVAALLNATVGFCLGCELYLIARRLQPSRG